MFLSLLTAGLLAATPIPSRIPANPLEPLAPASVPSSSYDAHRLRFSWQRDGALTALAGTLWLGGDSLLKGQLAPSECRWCDTDAAGRLRLNAVDRLGRGLVASTEAGRESAALWSNRLGFLMLPAGVLGVQYALAQAAGGGTRLFAEDAVIMAESVMLSLLANSAVKFAVGRQRPFVHGLSGQGAGSDGNLSFYSGHTSMAFALAVSAGTVAELRGYEHSWLVWAVGMPLATAVPLLRMRADRHYLTDVATGALMGSAFGVGVPLLLHGRLGEGGGGGRGGPRVRVSPMGMGASLSGTF